MMFSVDVAEEGYSQARENAGVSFRREKEGVAVTER